VSSSALGTAQLPPVHFTWYCTVSSSVRHYKISIKALGISSTQQCYTLCIIEQCDRHCTVFSSALGIVQYSAKNKAMHSVQKCTRHLKISITAQQWSKQSTVSVKRSALFRIQQRLCIVQILAMHCALFCIQQFVVFVSYPAVHIALYNTVSNRALDTIYLHRSQQRNRSFKISCNAKVLVGYPALPDVGTVPNKIQKSTKQCTGSASLHCLCRIVQ
jgi:hypothetical protein